MPTHDRLSSLTVPRGLRDVESPRYGRESLEPRIIHLGLGAFARAHLAVATEAALHASASTADARWGILGISLRQADVRDALEPQEVLYTVAVRDADETGQPRQRLQVIGCVVGVRLAPASPDGVLEAIASPAARIVSLTITEKGYLRDPASGELQQDHPDVVHDLACPAAPRSALGFIVHGLQRRRERGLGPLTLMSLDNLPANGRSLHRLVRSFAQRVDPTLARWIDSGCSFPSSMVDRIVPRTTESDRERIGAALGLHDASPVVTEPFLDWVVEDRFAAGRPDWGVYGVRFVEDAAPWERMKLRMVNGSHSTIAYLGAMAGWETVDRAVSQATLRRAVEALMAREIEPTLPPLPGADLSAYRARLLRRFANPALAHRTQQIAMDGSQKMPQRLLAPARERVRAGLPFPLIGLGIAGWLHYLRGHDELGRPYPIDDPLADTLRALHRQADDVSDPIERAQVLTRYAPVFGDLAGHPALVAAVAGPLESLRRRGVVATLDDAVGN